MVEAVALRVVEVSNALDDDDEIVVVIGGQGASRHSLDHVLVGHDQLLLVETDERPNVGPPAEQIASIAAAVERVLREREARRAPVRRAFFIGQSKGVAIGRALATSRPDLFKGGIGIGGACRNLRDIKPSSRTLMEFVAKSQLLGSGMDEFELENEWNEFAELAGRKLDASQFYVSVYVANDGDEVFKEDNCRSRDPHHLNIPIPPPDVSAVARISASPEVMRALDPWNVAPWLPDFYSQWFESPLGKLVSEGTLDAIRASQIPAPRTHLRASGLSFSGMELQRIPINHSLMGMSDACVDATRRGVRAMRAWTEPAPAVASGR
ncbi:hypothetical protein AYO38_07045 [bacterium SCGC AG-212-C10]|nr:hypothetical protein AYO38_07045 [bacterium SCGC AG-212-C10]